MSIIKFDKDPEFAELWDACIFRLLYDTDKYTEDLINLFKDLGINKDSNIIDVASGGGFPSLKLAQKGFNVICTDGSDDEIDLFNDKAKKLELNIVSKKVMWSDLDKKFPENSFDFILCRGNSFIYAAGGWNEEIEIDKGKSLAEYKKTLDIFYKILKPGGYLYVDKFKDSETDHREKVGEIQINDSDPEDLVFWTHRIIDRDIRKASMLRIKDRIEDGIPNVTYDLKFNELEKMIKDVGFSGIDFIDIPSEKHFDILIARK